MSIIKGILLTYLRLEALLYLNHREYYHKPLSYKDRQPHGNVDHLTNIIVILSKVRRSNVTVKRCQSISAILKLQEQTYRRKNLRAARQYIIGLLSETRPIPDVPGSTDQRMGVCSFVPHTITLVVRIA